MLWQMLLCTSNHTLLEYSRLLKLVFRSCQAQAYAQTVHSSSSGTIVCDGCVKCVVVVSCGACYRVIMSVFVQTDNVLFYCSVSTTRTTIKNVFINEKMRKF